MKCSSCREVVLNITRFSGWFHDRSLMSGCILFGVLVSATVDWDELWNITTYVSTSKCQIQPLPLSQLYYLPLSARIDKPRLPSLRANPHNAVLHAGHHNGVVTMWTPAMASPLIRMLAHPAPITSLAVDRSGRYMVTAGMDKQVGGRLDWIKFTFFIAWVKSYLWSADKSGSRRILAF